MNVTKTLGAAFVLALVGCGSSSGGGATPSGTGGSAGTEAGGSGGSSAGGSAAGGAAGSSGTGGTGGESAGGAAGQGGPAGTGGSSMAPPPTCPVTMFKSLVVLGDSISDVGSGANNADQMPFYRTLLVQNDDQLYPEYKGFDLHTCSMLDPNAGVVKLSQGGAVATEGGSGKSVLLNQAKMIPSDLPGPVLIVGTIGGNDVQGALPDLLLGNMTAYQKDQDNFAKGLDDAFAELTKPDRFGVGVKAVVLLTNVYDPSDGTGDFEFAPEMKKCPGALGLFPKGMATDPLLQPWEDIMTTEAAKFSGIQILDLHAWFHGHGVTTDVGTNWFHDDCIHPNALGQEQIRELMWQAIEVAQPLPITIAPKFGG